MAKNATWLKKRVAILDRDGHSCMRCGASGVRLHVHHRYYQDGKKTWDYEGQSLVSLCARCHGLADEMRRRLARAIGLLPFGEEEMVLGFLEARSMGEDGRISVSGDRSVGVAYALGLDYVDIDAMADSNGEVTCKELLDAHSDTVSKYVNERRRARNEAIGTDEADA